MKFNNITRREFVRGAGAFALAFPGLSKWTGLDWWMPESSSQVKRLIVMFSPNGMVRDGFWPKTEGPDFEMTEVLKPLESFREKMLVVKGICNKVRGDGDNHMRGMSCLLTGNELFPGNIQGGSDSPAGWCKGISIDQEIKNYLQANDATQTRFGTLEYGVLVPNEATPWTRMVYAGPNQPIGSISNPYRMFEKMYGELEDRENLSSVIGLVEEEIRRSQSNVDPRDSAMLRTHESLVRNFGKELENSDVQKFFVEPVDLPKNVAQNNDSMPTLSKMQIDLLVNGFANDLNRIATLQYTRSVGGARMRWVNVEEGHHALSHDPDNKDSSQEKLRRINHWYAQQLAYLCEQLEKTKEPGTDQSMLDNTLVIWTNELGHGNSHTLNDLPFVMVGGGFGFEMGRYKVVDGVSTTRLWLAVAHAMGHRLETFGLERLCKDGPVKL
ncbi:MAG: DUF1552 domain-containing protein [Planctomycetota bacterium]